jgi:hypothetical protein
MSEAKSDPVSVPPAAAENVPQSSTTLRRWIEKQERSRTRKKNLEQGANIFGFFIVQILLLVQFSVGAFRAQAYSDQVTSGILGLMALSVIMLLAAPDFTTRVMTRFMHATGRRVTDLVVNTMLVLLFVIALPFSRLFGRQGFAKNHKGGVAWVQPGLGFKGRSTWVPKRFEADQVNKRNRGTLMRTVVFFVGQRNWFLFVVVLALLVIASFLALASSPVLTPFIYPLF